MKTLTKTQAQMLVFDSVTYGIKTRCKKSKDTYASLRNRGYKTASEIADTNVPSSYMFNEQEGRLFIYSSSGCSEVIEASVKRKGWLIF